LIEFVIENLGGNIGYLSVNRRVVFGTTISSFSLPNPDTRTFAWSRAPTEAVSGGGVMPEIKQDCDLYAHIATSGLRDKRDRELGALGGF
jgi:hypothetical protein